MRNPFVTNGYVSDEYFCDRVKETEALISLATNGNNVALISQRRYGKTDLIRHCFAQPGIADRFYTFVIDIYATDSLEDFVNTLGHAILDVLKTRGRKAWEGFLGLVKSVHSGVTFDSNGTPSWTMELGAMTNPGITLEEIFKYLDSADRPCLVAIDEFQQILKYSDGNVEAMLRTYTQQCRNANFIFAGSRHTLMGAIFTSPARPFYQSVSIVNLDRIPCAAYQAFCQRFFEESGRHLADGLVEALYNRMDGVTFYMQKVMNILYMRTSTGEVSLDMLNSAVDFAIDFASATYEDLLYQLPEKQKRVLLAIAQEHKVVNAFSGEFVQRHHLVSTSSVNSAIKGLQERNLLMFNEGAYSVYDKFLEIWLSSRAVSPSLLLA